MSTEIKTKTERPDVLTTIALRKLGLAPPYKSCGWEVTPGGLIVYVKDTFIKSRGKNKGKRGWRGKRLKCFVGNGFGLGEGGLVGCSNLAGCVCPLLPNPCYTLARIIKNKF